MSRRGWERTNRNLVCRSFSSRLAAPPCAEATSLGDGERENGHDATLEQEALGVKILRLAQPVEMPYRQTKTDRSQKSIILTKTIRWKDWFRNGIPPA
jgi:hypothetical protein